MANENFDIFAIIPKAAEMMRASWNSLTPEQKAQSLLSRPTRLPDIKVDQPAQPTVEKDSIIKGVYQRGNQPYFPEAQTFPYTKPEDITSELQYERPALKETSKEPISKDLITSVPSLGINPAAELLDAYDKQTFSKYNNPGNIELTKIKWEGQVPNQSYGNGRFAVFATPEAGLRALSLDLTTKLNRHNGNLRAMIEEYAPASENDVDKYLKTVQRYAGVKDVYTKDDLKNIMKGFIRMENKPELAKKYIELL